MTPEPSCGAERPGSAATQTPCHAPETYIRAVDAYRQGLVRAESGAGSAEANLRQALALYEQAAAGFDPDHYPVEHARVLNAAGAAQRALGQPHRAGTLFARAGALLAGRGRAGEEAAAWNNLGLVRSEIGEHHLAVIAFDRALALFAGADAEERRGRWATLHNRGLAQAAGGGAAGIQAGIADYRMAIGELDPQEAPYHEGLLHHSLGVALAALACDPSLSAERHRDLLGEALGELERSLQVFKRERMLYQYAMAKHNAAAVLVRLGDPASARCAMVACDDSLAAADPRSYGDLRTRVLRTMAEAAALLPTGTTVADALVAAVAEGGPRQGHVLLAERMARLLALGTPQKTAAIAALAASSTRLPAEQAEAYMRVEILVAVELPAETLQGVLEARYLAHRHLSEPERLVADAALDRAIGVLGTPQRVFVRDFLYSRGFERP